jgi:phage-related protein
VWNIEYYQSEAGRSPVAEFIDSLEAAAKARVARTLDLLEEFGIELGMPYARHLEKQLWELRVRQARNRYRIIYFLASGQTFVLLHGLSKKTGQVPRSDLEIAERRLDDYLSRREGK